MFFLLREIKNTLIQTKKYKTQRNYTGYGDQKKYQINNITVNKFAVQIHGYCFINEPVYRSADEKEKRQTQE
jgi:hypothetical protein